ncbi:ranBP2-like and GRIP domain-containing protein 4 [Spea bombifrons]|uniref:ranBP2-like and GRIP domain-containing protein 4 n=1 Tax=Spea bombifrons TaxID=233779 RepID=UPI00234AEBDA|nr:ranBP2-like and GRIP domain-containing protein 4 [Spea bombifrons]
MRRSKPELQQYIESVHNSAASPREKSLKGFLIAKLYYEAKDYELAKRSVSSYINVQERDPKAHRFLGQLFENEGNIERAVGCYKRSLELNPTQKDLVLKIAELICSISVTDGRAVYWVEKASKLFPGNPVVYRLKEQLLNSQGEVGWNQLLDLIQSELFARPDDVHVNIRLVELFRSNKRLDEAVSHCLKPEKRPLRSNLDWCSCVLSVLKEYLASHQGSDKSKWRTINKELLLAHADVVVLTLSTRDVQESKEALESFDQALLAVKPFVNGADDLSGTFIEMRGHYYMHAGTQLLKMAQHGEVKWKPLLEPALLCYLLAFQVPKPKSKSIKGEENGQNILEGLACDRQSQSGHLLLLLSSGKDEFLSEVIETFANRSGQSILLKFLFGDHLTMENSFMGSDNISNISSQPPDVNDLNRFDHGAVRMHSGSLQHLIWLGLQWCFTLSLPAFRKWLKHLFPRLPQETSRIESNTPESLCILDLEVFLLGVVYTSYIQLQDNLNTSNDIHQPRCLPLPICKQLFTDRQKLWWDAVYSLIHKKALPGSSAKHRLVIQHDLNTLRALEKHGLQPAVIIHWARSLLTTGNGLNSFYDQREYMGRCVHYWKKALPLLDLVKQKKSIPEPVDPLFKHFHSKDIKVSEVADLEDEAAIAFAKLNFVEGRTDDAIQAFEAVKNVVSYWNLALVYQRKAEEIENDGLSSEEQGEYLNCMQKCKSYLLKTLEECSQDPSVEARLPVPLEAVNEMLDAVRQSLGDPEEQSPDFRHNHSFGTASGMKHSTPSPSKLSASPSKMASFSSKTPPRWAEDQKSILEDLCHQVEALKKEVQDLRLNSSLSNVSHRWPAEGYGTETATDGYTGPQSFYAVPLTVSTTGPAAYYGQSSAYNSQHLLRPASNVTPTKTSMYAMNRLTPQQHMYAYPQQTHTPPAPSTATCVFPPEVYGPPLRYETSATGIISPHSEEYYNYGLPQASTNPPLPEPGYFTQPSLVLQPSKSEGTKGMAFGKNCYGPTMVNEGPKPSNFPPMQSTPASTFKFNSNFKSNDGDFTFSSSHGGAPSNATFPDSECLLKLLTSDKQVLEQGKQSSDEVKSLFRFGDRGFSANINSSPGQEKTSTNFSQGDGGVFGFQTPGRSTYVPPGFGTQGKDAHNQSVESDAGSEQAADDDGPHFEPVVPLPEKIEVKTGEEEEEEMFCNRAKLFRFDVDSKEWKERGIGNVKILRHRVSGKLRLLMRREQVLKICANHYINSDMKLMPNATCDKSYVWHAYDYADEMPKYEQLAIRFKTKDEALHFKKKFEDAQKLLENIESNLSVTPGTDTKNSGNTGSAGSVKDTKSKTATAPLGILASTVALNKEANVPPASKSPATSISKTQPTGSDFTFSLKNISSNSVSQAIKTQSTSNGTAPPVVSASGFKFGSSEVISKAPSNSLETMFARKAGEWDCNVCLVRNKESAVTCASCQTPNPSSKSSTNANATQSKFTFGLENNSCKPVGQAVKPQSTTNATAPPVVSASGFKFGSSTVIGKPPSSSLETMFARQAGEWDCNVCLVRNKESAVTCASCQAPNPNPKSGTTANPPQSNFTFGLENNSSKLAGQAIKPQGTTNATAPAVVTTSGFKFGSSTVIGKPPSSTLETMFARKAGEWDCNVCLVRNKESAGTCASCQTPNPNSKSGTAVNPPQPNFALGMEMNSSKPVGQEIKPQSSTNATAPPVVSASGFKFGSSTVIGKPPSSSLETMFARKAGEWDCNVCLVRNKESACTCASCQTPNPNSKSTTATAPAVVTSGTAGPTNATVPAVTTSGFKFGSSTVVGKPPSNSLETMFARKAGEWDCNVCLVRNKESAGTCASCQTPNPKSTTNATAPAVGTSGFKFGSSTVIDKPPSSSLETMFARKAGEWDCNVCLVRNKESAGTCASCQTPNPNSKSTTATAPAGTTSTPTESNFTFGLKNNSTKPEGQAATEFKCNFPGKDFKFGTSEVKSSSFSFKPPVNEETKPTQESFGFSTPANSNFKFGLLESSKNEQKPKETTGGLIGALLSDVKVPVAPTQTGTASEETKQKQSGDLILGQTVNSFSFADLATNSGTEGFAFGKADPNFQGFTRAGEKLFVSSNKGDQANTSNDQEPAEELYNTDDRDDIHFEPIVQLPDKVELVTGEEDEKVLYSQRVKLFRFDGEIGQWKERGVGTLKILKNEVNGKLRILMRREQVLKVCANHWITTTMNLKPLLGSDRAWMWMANDFSDGDAKLENLAAKFKTPEQAEDFKSKFEACQRLLLDIPLQTPHKLVDTGRTARLIQKAEEMKSGLKDLKTFLTDQKPLDEGCTTGAVKSPPEATKPSFDKGEDEDSVGESLDDSVYGSPLADSPEKKNLFRFGQSAAGFNFSFQPVPSPSKSPTKLNQSRVSVGTDDESDLTQEEERDGQYFEPVVPLPDLIEVTSGEENEQPLFCNRAKLYRFDKETNQWKERGIGDLKILQNYDSKAVRVVMRRDQVLKLCANHRITADMNLQPMNGAERAWVWTAHDFTEGEGKVEFFAVRFKLQEAADLFKEVFEDAKQAPSKESLLTPRSSRTSTPKASPCGKAAVALFEEATRERTDQQSADDVDSQAECSVSSSSEQSSKVVVSPPKFVFGSEAVKNIFGTEKPKPFTFGNTASTGSLFGFSFNSSMTENGEQKQAPQPAASPEEPAQTGGVQETSTTKATHSTVQNPTVSSSSSLTGPSTLTQSMPARANNVGASETGTSPEVIFVYERTPTPEQKALAERLLLPHTFFCYKNKPGYISDESDVDDEDFETAVKKLNGRLYPETSEGKAALQMTESGSSHQSTTETEEVCEIVWEKKPTPEQKAKADSLMLPPTFFCGVTGETDDDEKENSEDFVSAVRNIKKAEELKQEAKISSTCGVEGERADVSSRPTKHVEKPDSTAGGAAEPVDLSSKVENVKPDSTSKGFGEIKFSFGLNSGSGLSFADLASNNSGDFAFGSKDTNFQWANTGAAVFGSVAQSHKGENEDDGNEEVVHSDEVYFEPIVSLPEVEVKSGEEEEEILFKERAKLYRWDRNVSQWKERGVGEIKILFHNEKKYYRVLMRRDQVLKVCANHVISKAIKLSPLNTTNNALVWTVTDYSEGEGKVEQFAARFKTQELADSFQRKFEECQQNLPEEKEESS